MRRQQEVSKVQDTPAGRCSPEFRFGVSGAGLGLRRELIPELKAYKPDVIDFFEIAPENWLEIGGSSARDLRYFTERYPFACHGLSLSLGGPEPLDELFLKRVKTFLREHDIKLYSEHLSYCSDDGQLYDLLPIPFTAEAVFYVAGHIRRAQDILERRIAIENASFYVAPSINEMPELEFINAVVAEADCWLHLDVNNVYVNSVNHRYDPIEFLRGLPRERVAYLHIAGHFNEADDLIVDTHAAAVIERVWQLLDFTYQHFGVHPTLLERDFNIPPLADLTREVERIAHLQSRYSRVDGMLPKPPEQALPAFQQYQFGFTRHIRDPEANPPPAGAEPRRMKIYNELLYNNVEGFLLKCFPVCREILGDDRWNPLVRDFFANHRSRAPLFRQIPEEFVRFLEHERAETEGDPPFLRHLAHYEWIELALDVADAKVDLAAIDSDGDLLTRQPVLNAVSLLLNYPYAVHRISRDYRPSSEESTWLFVFRNLDDRVKFIVLNQVSARLIELLQHQSITGAAALETICRDLRHPNPEIVEAGGVAILEDLRRQQAILGVRKSG